jgi:hypothetical protein
VCPSFRASHVSVRQLAIRARRVGVSGRDARIRIDAIDREVIPVRVRRPPRFRIQVLIRAPGLLARFQPERPALAGRSLFEASGQGLSHRARTNSGGVAQLAEV